MRSNDSVNLDKPLGMPTGLEPAHSPLAFSRRLVRVLRPVVQIPMLSVSNAGHHDSFRCRVAAQLVRDDYAWLSSCSTQQLAKETNCGKAIPLRLNKDIENNAVLIDGSPEIMRAAVDLEKDFIQMPFIPGSGASSSEAVGVMFAELLTPPPDRLVAEHDTTCRHHVFHIPKAHAETEVQPHAFGDDLFREPVTTVQAIRHSSSMASACSRST